MSQYREAWDKVLESSVFPWWEWSVKDNVVRFNDRKVTMLGFDPKDFAGKGFEAFTHLVHPDDHEKAMDAMRLVLSGGSNLYQIDYRIKTIKGTYLSFMDRGIVIERDAAGTPSVIRGVVIDLGERHSKDNNIESLLAIFERSSKITHGESSFITVCSVCHKVKEDEKHWVEMSPDLSNLISEKLSHGICPSCIRKLYPDIADKVIQNVERPAGRFRA